MKKELILTLNKILEDWSHLERLLYKGNEDTINESVNILMSSISHYSFERIFLERIIDFYSPFKKISSISKMGENHILKLLKIKNPITRFNKLNERKFQREKLLIEFKEYLFDILNMNTYHQEKDVNHIQFIEITIKDIQKKMNIMKNNLKIKTIDLIQIETIMVQLEVTQNNLITSKKSIFEEMMKY